MGEQSSRDNCSLNNSGTNKTNSNGTNPAWKEVKKRRKQTHRDIAIAL